MFKQQPEGSNDSNSFPSTAKESTSGAVVPPIREQRLELDNDPNLFPAPSEQGVQVSFKFALGCAFSYTDKLLGWSCFEGISGSVYPNRETIPLWK